MFIRHLISSVTFSDEPALPPTGRQGASLHGALLTTADLALPPRHWLMCQGRVIGANHNLENIFHFFSPVINNRFAFAAVTHLSTVSGN